MEVYLTTWVVLRGGLGNQLFCVAAGLMTAICSSDSQLIVDASLVSRSRTASRRCWADQFAWPKSTAGIRFRWLVPQGHLGSTVSSFPRLLLNAIDRYPRLRDNILAKLPRLEDRHTADGRVALFLNETGVARMLRVRHQTPDLSRALADVRGSDVAVHVRLGDYREYQGGKLVLTEAFYAEAIERFQSKPGRIRVFSDEPDEACALVRRAGVQGMDLVVPPALSPPETLELMAAHSRIVGSHSTFAYWAVVIAGEDRSVVMPRPVLTNYPIPWASII